jgi:predicted AlkP superfamily phosphohydrolase/phosphomutase
MKKVIVIGLDGLEPKIAEAMLKRGELSNLQKLQASGGYNRVKTTYPAQTPVAWSTFSTGTNPGGHGIFDFLSRDPKTYLPILGLSRYEQKNAFVPPKAINMRRGNPFWNLLSEAGISSTVIRCPCTYPPDEIKGRMLSGVGVPDLRGGLGTSTFYTTQPGVPAESSEKVVTIEAHEGVVKTHVIGPRDPRTRSDFTFDISLHINLQNNTVVVQSQGTPEKLEMKVGDWSGWLKVKFKLGFLQLIRGLVRFYLKQLDPIEFYASPVNFDAEMPLFPISSPAEYAKELEARIGTYYTSGMAEDHDGLNNGRFDEFAFLQQCHVVMEERKKMMLYELNRFSDGFFFCLFDTPDRLQHMFWRFKEPDHPAYPGLQNPELANAIETHYRECDAMVGEAMKFADPETLFITLSDHGMNSFQRGLNLNTWLFENGFLTLKNSARPGPDQGDFFHNVDWDKTQAYSLGLGVIFLNLKGREANGIVDVDRASDVKKAIASGLTGLPDPQRGKVAVRSVVTREEIYSGPFLHEAPDLVVNFAPGYRVSWDTPLGGVPDGLFADNTKFWGGDHVIDPALVPGVLFMNKPIAADEPTLVDLAPTILAALGVPKGKEMEGKDLLA